MNGHTLRLELISTTSTGDASRSQQTSQTRCKLRTSALPLGSRGLDSSQARRRIQSQSSVRDKTQMKKTNTQRNTLKIKTKMNSRRSQSREKFRNTYNSTTVSSMMEGSSCLHTATYSRSSIFESCNGQHTLNLKRAKSVKSSETDD